MQKSRQKLSSCPKDSKSTEKMKSQTKLNIVAVFKKYGKDIYTKFDPLNDFVRRVSYHFKVQECKNV